MSDETRSHAIKQRANALGIFSARGLHRMTQQVERPVGRNSVNAAWAGETSDDVYTRIESALTLFEERTGHDDGPDARVFEWSLTSPDGVTVAYKATVSSPEERREAEEYVARLLREMKPDV